MSVSFGPRIPGPLVAGRFPTFSGMACDRLVHWVCTGERVARDYEAMCLGSSRLLVLLLIHVYTLEGLDPWDKDELKALLSSSPESEELCTDCEDGTTHAVGDTLMCSEHIEKFLELRLADGDENSASLPGTWMMDGVGR